MKHLNRVLSAAIVSMCCGGALADLTPPGIVRVFDDDAPGVLDTTVKDLSGKRTRFMTMDTGALFGEAARRGAPAEERLVFNLFGDRALEATRQHRDLGIAGVPMWFGRLTGDADGYALFVKHDDAVVGKIVSPVFGNFEIIAPAGGFAEINEMDPTLERPCGSDNRHDIGAPGNAPAHGEHEGEAVEERGAETGTFIFADVLTAYTSIAAVQIGGTAAMLAWIDAEIAETNMVYENSQINLRIRNAGTVEENYTSDPQDMGVDLSRITNFDGIMDDVHTIRDQVGADLVHLIVPGPAANACGIAWLMIGVGPGFASSAFGVTARANCGNYVYAHELGHNMGCAHDRDNAGSASWPFAYGYRTPGNSYRTVMAYSPGIWSPYFSNPNVTYQGFAMGVAIGQPNPCFNAEAINRNASTIAAWRTLYTQPPGTFNLTSPADAATTPDRTPDFIWSEAADTDYYRLEVDNNSNFSSPEISVEPLTTESYTVPSAPPLALQPNTLYYWRVTAVNPIGTRVSTPASRTFTTPNVPPSAFSLSLPADGQVNVSRNPSFQWSLAVDADTYALTVDNDPGFGSPEITQSALIGTAYSWLGTPLDPNTTYYWKVTATNSVGTTASTPASRSFTTIGIVPGAFNLLSPSDGANIATRTPLLDWSDATFVDTYRVIVDDQQTLTTPVIDQAGLTATSYQVLPGVLLNNTRYYWQVQAINGAGSTNSTPAVATFAVILPVCQGDANGDGQINFTDISTVLVNWGGTGPQGDANGDGAVNFVDISNVLANWGGSC